MGDYSPVKQSEEEDDLFGSLTAKSINAPISRRASNTRRIAAVLAVLAVLALFLVLVASSTRREPVLREDEPLPPKGKVSFIEMQIFFIDLFFSGRLNSERKFCKNFEKMDF